MFKRLFKKNYLPLLLLIGLIAVLAQPAASAATHTSNWTETPPTIDGTTGIGEWTNAYQNSFTAYRISDSFPSFQVTLWAMNDGNNLYLCVQWTDSTYDSNGDRMDLYFDEHNDGNWSTPATENALMVYMDNTPDFQWMDAYGQYMTDPQNDTTSQDGAAAGSWASNTYTVEISIPIGSSDPEDLQPTNGSVMGIGFMAMDGATAIPYGYPLGVAFGITASFQLGSPLIYPYSLEGFIGFLVLVIGLLGVAVLFLRPRK